MYFDLWSLRKLGSISICQKIVRYLFHLWFWDSRIIKIRRGPLKGMSWFCKKEHQFWMPLGLYERETAQWLMENIKPGKIFFDIGSNAGYFTLIGSLLVRNGKTIAFDPVPLNVTVIAEQVRLNNITNVMVENCALSDDEGNVGFVIESCNANSHMSSVTIIQEKIKPFRNITVDAIRLDTYVQNKKVIPNIVKIDVEGAELKVLSGGIITFTNYRPIAIVSTHSEQLFNECIEFFNRINYKVSTLSNFEHELICYPQ